ncbi:class I SAM-dependent methyltransferase [Aquipuribacter sp. SD81]|uniref:class I SAM-dependent methyltransferase n=1 Tax=Aquipuribacter sp. SD81 TaxID=3127703 RepID=UPI003016719B
MPDTASPRRERRSTRAALRAAAVDALVEPVLARAQRETGGHEGRALVVDLGGGAGTYSVRLAEHGHDVVVVDPSPDALAALDRRAREAGVAERVRGHQGDARQLAGLLERPVDVLLCHDVLELVDDPAATLADVAGVLGPGGSLSLLTAQRSGAVALRAAAGRVEEALAVLTDPDGRAGPDDPLLRRLDAAATADLLRHAGLAVVDVVGVPVLADLVPEAVVDPDPRLREALQRLEAAALGHADLRGVASHLHWHAVRAGG